MGLLSFLFLILALRTNIVFVVIFATLSPAFCLLAGAYWQTSNGNADLASNLLVAAGACTFVTCAGGWWIFFAIMLAALDFPFQLPGKKSHTARFSSELTGCSWRFVDLDQGCEPETEGARESGVTLLSAEDGWHEPWT